MSQPQGALSARLIKGMMPEFIPSNMDGSVKQASLDLTITSEVYRVEHMFLPRPGETIRDILEQETRKEKVWPHPPGEPMWRGQTYLVKLNGPTSLPASVYGYANPKSSSGRIDTHVRMLADGVSRYDSLPKGWSGEIWLQIQPRSFHIKVEPGMSFNQMRFFTSDTRFNETELELAMAKHKLLWSVSKNKHIRYKKIKTSDRDGSIILNIDLESEIVGYKAIQTERVLDLSRKDNPSKDYFERIVRPSSERLTLTKGDFYILSTLEAVRVPTCYSCEMAPMDERTGEFRSHYAGFIDPGWGYGANGEGRGRQLTLEVRANENLVIRRWQPIAKIRFELMVEETDNYDAGGSNYVIQIGPTLGKFFLPLAA